MNAGSHRPMEALHLDTGRIATVCSSPAHGDQWVLWPCTHATNPR